ncbi:MAG: DUF5112 domain-containing protein [Bacteroidaceae bacterium]|nr:DUF5112 domain-containing protein [Bacteroidaceae bacterium]
MKATAVVLPIIALFIACSSADEPQSMCSRDNDLAYRLRYTDISASHKAAKEAYDCSSGNADEKAEALNNLAYASYQQMRYDQSLSFLQELYGFSRNQLELLCADVLTMKIMQRIGRGKSFFDSRLHAQKRLKRILSEENSLTNRQRHRLHYAQTEFHIVASTYYYYLGQDSAARQEIEDAAQHVKLETDTTQWLYYHYMVGSGGLVEGTPEEVTVTEFNHLFRVYTLAKANRYVYFEANALQSLSAMIADSLRANWIKQQRIDAYSYLYGEHLQWQADSTLSLRHQFAAALSHHAVALFKQYDDLFQTACALRTLGEVYFSAEHYDEALESFQSALLLTSDHSRSPYQVTPWLAGIHENLSLTYSALGDKQQADTHRNIYLDLLDQSRQNKELDSRKALLKQEARSEQIKFLLLLLLVFVVAVLSIIYYRQLGHRSRSFEQKVRDISSSEECLQAEQRLQNLLQESEEKLEESREACDVMQQRILQEEQRHIMQRTKLSVVYAIIPYLDRVISEVKRLDETGENASDRLSYIQELCAGMMTINDRLTSWIQMQQGRLSLQVSRFPLSDVLQVISMQQYAFAQQQLTLEVPDTNLQVKADKPLTLFMVNTLVDNARKFTPAGGKVSIVADSTDDYVEVSVCDTGIGLSAEDVQTLNDSKVYDPNRIGTKNASKGFGFGIMNCKGIINSYRKLSSLFNVCDFGVESEQGKGSRFWFRLPRVLPLLFLLLSNLSINAMPQRCYELYDSTYTANLEGRYADACFYADSAIHLMEAPIDTLLLVKLYNEQAIAAQALGEWDVYRQSNAECVRLHRLYSTDGTLASDCQRLEKMTEDSRVLYVLIVLLLIASLTLFYMVVLRHRLRHRASLDDLYQRLTSVLQSFPENASALDDEMQTIIHSLEQPHLKKTIQELRQKFALDLAKVQEAEASIEEAEEKLQKQRFEHDRLYVMNQILDNSLSTIKHETMYFPSRIKQMTDEMQDKGFDVETHHNLLDLVTYYRHIYMLLYEQAQRQTDQSLLRIQSLAVNDLFAYASKTYGIACQSTEAHVKGNEMLLRMFFDQMLAAVSANAALSAEESGDMTYIIYNVEGHLTPEQLSELFSPQTEQLEYLVMRQIIREHDAACGHPGLRLKAESTEQGYRIVFSLPNKTSI